LKSEKQNKEAAMTDWSHKGLWSKALLYAGRATEQERTSPLYPLWSTFVLEFIGRSCLANIHPAMLADSKSDENILHAFGYPIKVIPRSIPASVVFRRCRSIVKEFTEDDFTATMKLIERRNAELHSGTSGFAGYGTELWLSDYFRICRLLLVAQQKSLVDLLGIEEAAAAEKMITASEEKVIGAVKKAIADAKNMFEALNPTLQEGCKKAAEIQIKVIKGKLVDCPSCGCKAIVRGERVSVKKPQIDDDTETLYRRAVMLPTSLDCFCCKLSLKGHAALHVAGAGGSYEIMEEIDPAKYFGIEQPSEDAIQNYAEEWMRDMAADYWAEQNEDG
jgi:hypothetical protein